MDTPAPITDDDIKAIVATTTMAEFRAAIAPWEQDGGARKKMVQKLHGGISDHFTWQKHEFLRLWREIDGAEPTVATVLAAEVKRFGNRLAGKDFPALNGLTLEYEPGFLEGIEKRFAAQAKQGPDVHRAVMNDISDPVSRYLSSREGRNIGARRNKYPNMRMTLGRDAKGGAVFTLTSPEEQAALAEKKRQLDIHVSRIAGTPDLERFIAAVTAKDKDFRKRVKEKVEATAGDPLLTWQKREVFAMLAQGQQPDAASLTVAGRIAASLEMGRTVLQSQFNAAVKGISVMPSEAVMAEMTAAVLDMNTGAGLPVRKVVGEHYVTPVVQWMKQNVGAVKTLAQAFDDTIVVVDALGAPGRPAQAHAYSARQAFGIWVKNGLKTGEKLAAPRTASFRKRQPQNIT